MRARKPFLRRLVPGVAAVLAVLTAGFLWTARKESLPGFREGPADAANRNELSLAHLRAGERCKQEGDLRGARRHLAQSLRLNPRLNHARFMLAEMDQADLKFDRAHKVFRQIYAANPSDPGPGMKAAETWRQRGDRGRAIAEYREVVSRSPDLSLAHFWLGVLYAEGFEYGHACRHFGEACRIDPRFEEARRRWWAFAEPNRPGRELAAEPVRGAVRWGGGAVTGVAALILGGLLVGLRRDLPRAARRRWRPGARRLAVLAGMTALCIAAVWMLRCRREAGMAKADVPQQILRDVQLEPGDAVAWYRLGESQKAAGQWKSALRSLERAITLEPDLSAARFLIGEIYQDRGWYRDAYRVFMRVYLQYPDDVGPALKCAEMCREYGDVDRAVLLYRHILKRSPKETLAHRWLGLLLMQRLEYAQARAHLTAALRLEPGDDYVRDRLDQLTRTPVADVAFARMRPHIWTIASPLLVSIVLGVAMVVLHRFLPRLRALLPPGRMLHAHVYLWSLSALLFAHYMKVTRDASLNGEELAVAYRNVVYLPLRLQYDHYSTNFAGTFFFWLGSHVFPIGVNSQRLFKLAVCAALPGILLLFHRRLAGSGGRAGGAITAALFALSPALAWLFIMSTEYALESVFALAVLAGALRVRVSGGGTGALLRCAGIALLAGLALHTYGSAVAVLPVAVAVLVWRCLRTTAPRSLRLAMSGVTIATAALAACWPYFYFINDRIFVFAGGGRLSRGWEDLAGGISALTRDLFGRPDSYMLADSVPSGVFALESGGPGVLALAAIGAVRVWKDRSVTGMALFGVAVLSLFMQLMIAENPGIRRAVPLVAVVFILAGVGLAGLIGSAWRDGRRLLMAGAISLALLLSAAGAVTFARAYGHVHLHYCAWLQREFPFLPGKDYEQTVESLVAAVGRGQLVFREGESTFDQVLLLRLICERRGLPYIPPRYSGFWDEKLPRAEFIAP